MIKHLKKLLKFFLPVNPADQYLLESKDIYELENRMRQIQDRESRLWN